MRAVVATQNADGLREWGGPCSEVKKETRTKSGAGDMSYRGHPTPAATPRPSWANGLISKNRVAQHPTTPLKPGA